jgi:hypothetical protein
LMWLGLCNGTHTIPIVPEEIETSLVADKRNIIMSYRGVDVKVQIHSILEEVEMRGWAKIKSAGVQSGRLVGLWCEASLYYPLSPWPWWMSSHLALSTLEVHMLSKLMLCVFLYVDIGWFLPWGWTHGLGVAFSAWAADVWSM